MSGAPNCPMEDIPEVTPEMVEAGFRVLAESGLGGDDLLEVDRLLVARIYRAMDAYRHLGSAPLSA